MKSIMFEFEVNPIVAILGPRQCGKTTLSRQFISVNDDLYKENYFDLEDPLDIERLSNPILTLPQLKGLIVINEIQKIPDLFSSLRLLVDDNKLNQKYLILGSASKELIKQSSETLAGRISYLELTPFSCFEVYEIKKLWLYGGYPRAFLAKDDKTSNAWKKAHIKTYLEQDIPNLGIDIAPDKLRRFWMMLSHYHGCIFNASEIARSLGFSYMKIQYYTDILTGTFMIRQLQPWYINILKSQENLWIKNLKQSRITIPIRFEFC